MGKYFGTDGFRGAANINLTVYQAFEIGRFLGWHFGKKARERGDERARVLIGKDTRRSSYMFEYALCAGLTASGAEACIMHVTTTPSVSYITKVDSFDCGIMISASHNVFSDNGIKLIGPSGEKLDDETIALIEEHLDGKTEIPLATGKDIGRTTDYVSGRNRYIGYLISLGLYSFKGMKVGLDCANGSSWNIAESVFNALGAKTYVINAEPDGTNINRDAGSLHIEGLCKLVKEKGLDVGFAYDGDADRCLCVDENGEVVDGDKILYVYARYLKERGELTNNTVVATIMSNGGFLKALEEFGIEYALTAVGDKNVHEYMSQHGNKIGGEQSGHIIFSKYASTGDGILTSLKIMEVMMAKKMSLSKLTEPVKLFPQITKNIYVSDKNAVSADEDVLSAAEQARQLCGERGRVLLRASGTEPCVRITVECESEEICRNSVELVENTIRTKGYIG